MPVNALKIENLKKTYRNGTVALRGVNLDVMEGDFFALLGPNGAGKSTTISIISSLTNKTTGKVQVFGHDIDQDPAMARSMIGLVPQEFNFNIFEPVIEILINQAGFYGIGRKVATQRAEKYLRKLELWDKRFDMAKELSGGMKRRLMIARALVHEPKLLILDEPTAGVDIEIRHSMWAFMREINASGTTIILTTHYLEEAESLCNHIAIIDKGVTIEHTSMRTLLDRLRVETFVLYLEESLSEAPICGDYPLKLVDSNTLEVGVAHSQTLNEFFHLLSECNIKVLSMRNKTNRLEQLFVSMMRDGNAENYRGGEA